MQLYHHPFSPSARRVLMAADHLGVVLDLVEINLASPDDRRRIEEVNDNGKIPVLVDDGFVLWESCAIMQYLADGTPGQTIYPQERVARADVNRWMFWSAQHFSPAIGVIAWENMWKKVVTGLDADGGVERGGVLHPPVDPRAGEDGCRHLRLAAVVGRAEVLERADDADDPRLDGRAAPLVGRGLLALTGRERLQAEAVSQTDVVLAEEGLVDHHLVRRVRRRQASGDDDRSPEGRRHPWVEHGGEEDDLLGRLVGVAGAGHDPGAHRSAVSAGHLRQAADDVSLGHLVVLEAGGHVGVLDRGDARRAERDVQLGAVRRGEEAVEHLIGSARRIPGG